MRQKRAKSYKKQMNIYLHTFKFREPYQTIVDDQLVLQSEKASFNLTKALGKTIQGETKPMITQCCMQALYLTKNQAAIDLGKSFERRRCNHSIKDPKSPQECIESVVNVDGVNKHRYIVATQALDLRKKLRAVPGVPLIFMNRSVMVMEPASHASLRAATLSENAKLTGGLNDSKIGLIQKEAKEEQEEGQPPKKKKRGPKGPNPLSVKKKSSLLEKKQDDKEEKPKKRTRRHRKAGEKSENGENKENEAHSENDAAGNASQANDDSE